MRGGLYKSGVSFVQPPAMIHLWHISNSMGRLDDSEGVHLQSSTSESLQYIYFSWGIALTTQVGWFGKSRAR